MRHKNNYGFYGEVKKIMQTSFRLMLHRLGLIFILLFLSTVVKAQSADTFHLEGYMGVQGGESFHYELTVFPGIGNTLKGYSLLYKHRQQNAVKTAVLAVVDRKEKTLFIREQDIIYNHNFKSNATICLVKAKLKVDASGDKLSGSLITQVVDNGPRCSTGSINFIKKAQIYHLFNPAPPQKKEAKKEVNTANSSFPLKENPTKKLNAYFARKKKREQLTRQKNLQAQREKLQKAQEKKKKKIKIITKGQDGIYYWQSDKIIFKIWDGGDIDNDMVTVYYNGTKILDHYTLKATKKTLTLNLGDQPLNVLMIEANNEGANPPNTANIIISDGAKDYSIMAYNKTGQKAFIQIKKGK